MDEARMILEGTTPEKRRGTVLELMADDTPRRVVLERRWGKLLNGHSDKTPKLAEGTYKRAVMATLLENQLQTLKYVNESTGVAATPEFVKYVFPILRRVWATLISSNLVGIQPMNAPIGGIFTREIKYQSDKAGTTSGQNAIQTFNEWFTSEYVEGELAATGNGIDYGGGGAALGYTVNWFPVRALDATEGYSVLIQEETSAGVVVQTVTFTLAGTSGTGDYSAGTFVHSTGVLSGFKFTAAVTLNNLVKMYYYYNSEMSDKIPQFGTEITLQEIKARTRKLKAKWSIEGAQDMKAMLDLDVDALLTDDMVSEIGLEVDRELEMDLYANATGATANFNRQVPAGITEIDHLRALVTKLSTVSSEIMRKVRRGPANWFVTSTAIGALLNVLPEFKRTGDWEGDQGIKEAGVLNGSWRVFIDPMFFASKMLVGRKGGSFLDEGFVYAPYVPLMITPPFLDPDNFTNIKGMITRYAKKLINGDYYGIVTVSNL